MFFQLLRWKARKSICECLPSRTHLQQTNTRHLDACFLLNAAIIFMMRTSFIVVFVTSLFYVCIVQGLQFNNIQANIRNDDFQFKSVYVAESEDTGSNYQTVLVAFAIRKLNFTSMGNIHLSNNFSVSLQHDSLYSYVRLFVEQHASINCSYSDFLAKSDDGKFFDNFPVRFPVSATVQFWWGDKDKNTFLMKVVLLKGKDYQFSLIRGPEKCRIPLESLSNKEMAFVTRECKGNINEKCPALCSYWPSMNSSQDLVLVNFRYSVQPLVSNSLIVPTSSSNTKRCSMSNTIGLWDGNRWCSPLMCNISDPKTVAAVTPNLVQESSHSNVATIKFKNTVGTACFIGDSHIYYVKRSFFVTQTPYHTLNWDWKAVSNFVTYPSMTQVIGGYKGHEEDMSAVTAFNICIDGIKAADLPGALVWWFGSHAMHLSAEETARTIQLGVDTIRHRNEIDSKFCVVIVGVMDTMFENIPVKLSAQAKYFQNSWRIQVQNNAIREAVAALNISGLHFVDIFPQTLALHYHGHRAYDPVHYNANFYKYLGQFLVESIRNLCVN